MCCCLRASMSIAVHRNVAVVVVVVGVANAVVEELFNVALGRHTLKSIVMIAILIEAQY